MRYNHSHLLLFFVLLAIPLRGFAQTPAPAPAQPVPTTAPTLEEKVKEIDQKLKILERRAEVAEEVANARNAAATSKGDELSLKSPSGDLTLNFNGILQADARIFLNDDARALTDTFVPRTVRPVFSGTYANLLRWQFTPDFGGGVATIQDAWVDLLLGEYVTVRVGKMIVPFGLERWQGTTALRFVERAYPTQLAPNRDLGILIFGHLWDKRLDWAVGAFNGGVDNALTDTDFNDSKELVGRLFVQPFAKAESEWIQSLLIGGAVTWGDQDGKDPNTNTPSWKTPGQNPFYSFRTGEVDKDKKPIANPIAQGARLRWTAHLWWAPGPFALLAEYVSVSEPMARDTATGNWQASAWQGALSYVIGGKPSFSGTKVNTPFRVGADGWGALEIAARASAITTDNSTFSTWADPGKSASSATSFTGGVRWHLSTHYRLFVDYEHTIFTGGAKDSTGVIDRKTEQAVLARVQLAY